MKLRRKNTSDTLSKLKHGFTRKQRTKRFKECTIFVKKLQTLFEAL